MIYSDRKKSRGQQRKLNELCRRIDEFVPFMKIECKYEHFHVPCDNFLEHPKTSSKIKTSFFAKWLDTAEKFISEKPAGFDFCRVVAAIYPDHLWDSQIIIFYDQEYYDWFFTRGNVSDEAWTPINDSSRSFAKERNIQTPLAELGYIHGYTEDATYAEDKIWFYGEIPKNQ